MTEKNIESNDTNVALTDHDGSTLDCKWFNGLRLPKRASDQALGELQHFQAREDDVIVCGYPKCGTSWALDATSMLLGGSIDCRMSQLKIAWMLEFGAGDTINQIPSPRLFKTHLPYDMLPEDFKRKKCRLVYPLRNPKDVAVSQYNHYSNVESIDFRGTWNEYLTMFLDGRVYYGNYFDYLKTWDKAIESEKGVPILPVYYENLKQDFKTEARKLCEFLHITRSDDFIASVTEACDFGKSKSETEKNKPIVSFRKGTSFFRKGIVGDWKEWFTVAQNERFDEISREKMEGLNNLHFEYTIA